MWVSHHSMFERIATVDRRLLFLNLLLLLGIAFLPFPTSLLAQYIREGGQNASISAAIYSGTMCLIGIVFFFMRAMALSNTRWPSTEARQRHSPPASSTG